MRMKSFLFLLFTTFSAGTTVAQTVTTIPAFPRADESVTITVDATGTSLAGYPANSSNPVWLWAWIAQGCSASCDAPTNVDPATDAQNGAKMVPIGNNKYVITLTPTIFFNKPASEIQKMGVKLKTRAWSDDKQTDNDKFIDFAEGLQLSITSPSAFPVFKNAGEQLVITANASEASALAIAINGGTVKTATAATNITYTQSVSGTGSSTVTITADNGTESVEKSFTYTVRTATVAAARPAGIVDGINYSG